MHKCCGKASHLQRTAHVGIYVRFQSYYLVLKLPLAATLTVSSHWLARYILPSTDRYVHTSIHGFIHHPSWIVFVLKHLHAAPSVINSSFSPSIHLFLPHPHSAPPPPISSKCQSLSRQSAGVCMLTGPHKSFVGFMVYGRKCTGFSSWLICHSLSLLLSSFLTSNSSSLLMCLLFFCPSSL